MPHNLRYIFGELIVHLNLCQLIISSTHNAGNILDLILTNNDQLVHDIVIRHVLPSGLSSDHFIVTFKVLASVISYKNSGPTRKHSQLFQSKLGSNERLFQSI